MRADDAPFRLVLHRPTHYRFHFHLISTHQAGVVPTGFSRLTQCPCSPARLAELRANGTIDGVDFGDAGCSRWLLDEHNPTCFERLYGGGLRCCEHGFVQGTAACTTPDCSELPVDTFLFKFDVFYEDATPSTRELNGGTSAGLTFKATLDGTGPPNSEYDIPQCKAGTPSAQCVHVHNYETSIFEAATAPDLPGHGVYDLHQARPHMHAGALSIALIDGVTNETLCSLSRDDGGLIYDDMNYLVAVRPCTWSGASAPRLAVNQTLRGVAVYDATEVAYGVMAEWILALAKPL